MNDLCAQFVVCLNRKEEGAIEAGDTLAIKNALTDGNISCSSPRYWGTSKH